VTGVVACIPYPSSIRRSLSDMPRCRSCTIQLLSSPRLTMSASKVLLNQKQSIKFFNPFKILFFFTSSFLLLLKEKKKCSICKISLSPHYLRFPKSKNPKTIAN
jgi:hypothetical protein